MSTNVQRRFKIDSTEDLESWMTNLPEKLRLVPLIYLAIPGSHDSFTSNITATSEMSPDAEEILQLLEFLGPILKYFIANWSRTQSHMAADQLTRGIRYFDLRIATKEGTKDFFFVHGLYSDNVQVAFKEIVEFLNDHPQEVVILDCQHFYAFTTADHASLMQMLAQTFDSKLLPYSETMDHITLDYMTNQNQYQVIVIYRSDDAIQEPLLWPSASFPTPWADTDSIPVLLAALDNGIQNRSSSVAFISQCILTPSVDFIFRHLCSTLKKKCAQDLEVSKLEWISKQKTGEGGMNIIISDYIELSDCEYVKQVIELNDQLLRNCSKSNDVVITIEKS